MMADFSSLADELLLHAASFLAPVDLLQLECLSSYTNHLDTDIIWRKACQRRWQKWPMYQSLLTSEERSSRSSGRNRCNDPRLVGVGWKEKYRIVECDVIRTEITMEELEDLNWYFNYTTGAHRILDVTLLKCSFKDSFLFLEGYPPLPVYIKEQEPPQPPPNQWFSICADEFAARPFSKRQWLQIAEFEPHFISRTHDAEWLIMTVNVTFVSCSDDSHDKTNNGTTK